MFKLKNPHERRAAGIMPPTVWSNLFSAKRGVVGAEMNLLAAARGSAAVPDFGMRLERVSTAMYLLGRMNSILRSGETSLVWPAFLNVVQLLEAPFFRDSSSLVRLNYEAIQGSLSDAGFPLLDAEAAARKYAAYAEKRVESIRKMQRLP